MAKNQPMECRVVITYRPDKRIDLGMYHPGSLRYEPLGTHGPSQEVIDRVVIGLKERIEREGFRLTFCEQTIGLVGEEGATLTRIK